MSLRSIGDSARRIDDIGASSGGDGEVGSNWRERKRVEASQRLYEL